jgi:hypothetical protein
MRKDGVFAAVVGFGADAAGFAAGGAAGFGL